MPKVVRKLGTLSLMVPLRSQTTIAKPSAIMSDHVGTIIESLPAIIPVLSTATTLMTEPTERSISPATFMYVWPIETIMRTMAASRVLNRLAGFKKNGLVAAPKMQTAAARMAQAGVVRLVAKN